MDFTINENQKMGDRRRLMKKNKNPKAQWKFLEQPARELRDEFMEIITIAIKAGLSVSDALYLAGLRFL